MSIFWMGLFLFSVCLFAGVYIYIAIRKRDRVDLLNVASWVALGIAFFLIIHIIGLMIYPFKIQEVDQPVKVLNENHQVKRGESPILQAHIKKYVSIGSTIYPAILCDDGTYITYPERASNVPEGEGTYTLPNLYPVPLDTPLTTCHTIATDVFQLNIFRSKTFIHHSEGFQIIE